MRNPFFLVSSFNISFSIWASIPSQHFYQGMDDKDWKLIQIGSCFLSNHSSLPHRVNSILSAVAQIDSNNKFDSSVRCLSDDIFQLKFIQSIRKRANQICWILFAIFYFHCLILIRCLVSMLINSTFLTVQISIKAECEHCTHLTTLVNPWIDRFWYRTENLSSYFRKNKRGWRRRRLISSR